ncbi:hypothetical protein CONPUDRAFT_148287 [Coniophora puteana RWD-64-598 SS2]|uniref:DUF6533 domain-containing protein n=1 Tax=Coniophora puteana (strain RWD-64-598) TaxID=741705 RepID=A0A5M3N5P2_CONPW|nr:uncharacterized protein CONPUDRAFT_148287 [Coniophora puteana RWD-64-598 SS2]EIW86185.1 hypothetical protein CONPUDRAFT_148287 [Coniophora puteana RWD-64-598 SS2]
MQDWDEDAILRSYQTRNYIGVAITMFWLYDYLIEINAEWIFMRYAKLRKTKVIYLLTRLLPFAAHGARLTYDLSASPASTTCHRLSSAMNAFAILIVILAEVLFSLRTYALWRRSRTVLILLIGSFAAAIAGGIAVWYIPAGTTDSATETDVFLPPTSSVTGCASVSPGISAALSYSFLLVVEIELIILNVMKGVRVRRETRARFVEILIGHNVLYYVCGTVFTVINVTMGILGGYGDVTIYQE